MRSDSKFDTCKIYTTLSIFIIIDLVLFESESKKQKMCLIHVNSASGILDKNMSISVIRIRQMLFGYNLAEKSVYKLILIKIVCKLNYANSSDFCINQESIVAMESTFRFIFNYWLQSVCWTNSKYEMLIDWFNIITLIGLFKSIIAVSNSRVL